MLIHKVNELPFKLSVGTVFSHSRKGYREDTFYKYQITGIELTDENRNDNILLKLLESNLLMSECVTEFEAEPQWFMERKIRFIEQ
jgi:hypothetical protein